MTILLIQTTLDPVVADHGYAAVLKYSGLQPDQVRRLNTYADLLDVSVLDGVSGVIIGGSGECNVSRREPTEQFDALSRLVHAIIERGLPTLGLCYGGHLLAHVLGGVVEYRPSTKEVGTVALHRLATVTPDDPLLGDLPPDVLAQCGHTDDIMQLPLTAVPLYNSDKIQYHVFKVAGQPIYGFQSHPELGVTEMAERLAAVVDFGKYLSAEQLEPLIGQLQDTPEWNGILKKFVAVVERAPLD